MPTYLCHGFRWSRRNIRVYVVVQNLDDAAPEWIIKPGSSKCVLESFYTLFDFLPACAPPGNDKLQYRRAFNHTNYYNLYNEPPDKGRGQGMGTAASSGRLRSHSTSRRLPYHDHISEEGGEKGWWGRHREREEDRDSDRGHGFSHSYSNSLSQSSGGARGDMDWGRRQHYHHLAPGKPRSQSESRVMPNVSHVHNNYQRAHSHSRSRAYGPPSVASSASSTTLGATATTNGSRSASSRTKDAPLPPPPEPENDDVLHNEWSVIKLLEEHDPNDLTSVSQDYAYVADYVVKVDLSVSIMEEMVKYEERQRAGDGAMSGPTDETLGRAGHNMKVAVEGGTSSSMAGWFEKLRDQLQSGEDIKWYVVVCGDEERNPGATQFDDDGETVESYESTEYLAGTATTSGQTGGWIDDKMRAEQDDYERRRRMLQLQFGKPPDNDAEPDTAIVTSQAPVVAQWEQERNRTKKVVEKERQKRIFEAQVQNPPKVPEKDYPPSRSRSRSRSRSQSATLRSMKSMADVGTAGKGARERSRPPKGSLRRLFSRGRLLDERGGVAG